MSLAVEVAGKTDVGCVRANNEDNFGYDSRHGIFVVCDGMGGHAAGEVASKMGVDTLLDYFRAHTRPGANEGKDQAGYPGSPEKSAASEAAQATAAASPDAASLAAAIRLANRKIYEAGRQDESRSGMGSTIVAALVHGHALAIANVGDSRIYLIRQGEIQQLTRDHSWIAEQVRLGYLTSEQAEQSDMQNVVLRALGTEEEVQADIEDLLAVSGDVLLMTSDGLTRYVRDQEILEIVTKSPALEQACAVLIRTAKERGGKDNITCLLVRIVERPWYKSILNKLFSGGAQWQNSV